MAYKHSLLAAKPFAVVSEIKSDLTSASSDWLEKHGAEASEGDSIAIISKGTYLETNADSLTIWVMLWHRIPGKLHLPLA